MKRIYHLPQATANGLLYCRTRDGGLAIPKLETIVSVASLKAGWGFTSSEDPVIRAIAVESGLSERLKTLAAANRINWPPKNKEAFNKHKLGVKKEELSRWCALTSQGKAVENLVDDVIGNAWLRDTTLLKPCQMVTALKLRANLAGNRTAMHKITPQVDVACRKCDVQHETLGHILGQCESTKKARIKRHNEIRDFVMAKTLKKGMAVTKETIVGLPTGNLKPDLVIQHQGRVFVVDITVRHEDGGNMLRGYDEKIGKYTCLLPHFREQLHNVTGGEVLPIVVGTRGAMPSYTRQALAKLGIDDRSTLLTISLMALRCSVNIYHRFMDYNYSAPAPVRPPEPHLGALQ